MTEKEIMKRYEDYLKEIERYEELKDRYGEDYIDWMTLDKGTAEEHLAYSRCACSYGMLILQRNILKQMRKEMLKEGVLI